MRGDLDEALLLATIDLYQYFAIAWPLLPIYAVLHWHPSVC